MSTLAIKRVVALPQVLEPSALYIVQNADNVHADLYFTGNDSSIVRRSVTTQDISNQITQAISEGTAAKSETANKLSTIRLIAATGDAHWQVEFDGSGDAVGNLSLKETGIDPGEYPVIEVDLKGRAIGGRSLKYSDIPFIPGDKVTTDVSVNTTGNAGTATKLQTPVLINNVAFDGSQSIIINATDSVDRIATSEKAAPSGVATLNEFGTIPLEQLPSQVYNVEEYFSLANFPNTGTSARLYIAQDTGLLYRWNSVEYVQIGTTAATSTGTIVLSINGRSGDVVLNRTDVGLGNVNNTADLNKPISIATQAALDGKAASSHSHAVSDVTGLETRLNTFAPLSALDNYYTISSITVKFDALDAKKADVIHSHSIADVMGLQTSLNSKADVTHTHTKAEFGLDNVDNTSDVNKPISIATLTALNAKVNSNLIGAAGGVASLDASGKVPASQLPSYVDDVVEGASLAAFPVTGETGKIYVALDTSRAYRWSGSTYTAIIAGTVDSVNGKTGIVTLTKSDIGLSNVDNTSDALKPISAATQSALDSKASSVHTHLKSEVGLGNVDNTSDANKPISTAAQAALDGKAAVNHTHTYTKVDVGLGNVDNTSDANKPVSTAQATAISNAQAAAIAASAPSSHVGAGGSAHAAVTTGVNGFMLASDKVKLDAITGTNTGDETAATIKSKLGITVLSGNNTGDQTSVTGNAGTATKLQTARLINGVSFDGSTDITINAVDSTSRIASTEKGTINGVATLDATGKVPSAQLPSYVDDVVEGTSLASFPATGETGKIYVALDTNKCYRWGGSSYTAITSGAVDSVAGKTGVVTLVKADVGLSNVDNTSDVNKPVSTAQNTAISNAQAAAIAASAPVSHVGSSGTAHAAVTTAVNGFMLSTDKVKLDAITGTNTGDETAATIKSKLGITTLSGSNTGDQTSVSGNAGTATKLQTARTINGVSFDGSANITINAVDSTARVASSLLGVANGVATLDASGTIPTSQLPSYVDDVLEYANLAGFPVSGSTGKIYVALDTNKCYRWSGSAYIFITSGAVDSVAGKTGVVTLVKADVGLSNVDNTSDVNKPVSTAQAAADTAVQNAAASDATTKANAAQAAAIAASAPSSHVGASGTAHAIVTTTVNGFMSSSDKVKLDAITGTNTGDETAATIKTKLGITTLSGSNTGDQTTITGNAGTATKLQTARTINGVSFDGSANITINAVDATARIATSEKAVANGVATLGADGKVPAAQLPASAGSPVTSVNTKIGDVVLTKADIGLTNVDNTSDVSKPMSTPTKNYVDASISNVFRSGSFNGSSVLLEPMSIMVNGEPQLLFNNKGSVVVSGVL